MNEQQARERAEIMANRAYMAGSPYARVFYEGYMAAWRDEQVAVHARNVLTRLKGFKNNG